MVSGGGSGKATSVCSACKKLVDFFPVVSEGFWLHLGDYTKLCEGAKAVAGEPR